MRENSNLQILHSETVSHPLNMIFTRKLKQVQLVSLVLAIVLFHSSCATMFYGAKQKTRITSEPSGAQIYVNGVNTGSVTPAKIKVKRRIKKTATTQKNTQIYTLKKQGFEDAVRSDRGTVSAGALIVSLGLWPLALLVDLPVGAFRKYPRKVAMTLSPSREPERKLVENLSPEERIKELEKQKQEAVANENYALANELKKEIEKVGNPTTIKDLEKQIAEAVDKQDFVLAGTLKKELDKKRGVPVKVVPRNNRDKEWIEIKSRKRSTNGSVAVGASNTETRGSVAKIKKEKLQNENGNVKYRRSSLYTLMISDSTRLHADVIKDAFGNAEFSQKFNNHNVGPYLVEGTAAQKDQSQMLTSYVNQNNVAKELVAKWFNRDAEGRFNMDLIAERGMYDASAFDIQVASASQRGNAMLADAGEELLKKTFVIVNDYKFTDKAEIAAKAKKAGGFVKMAAAFVPGGDAISSGIDLATTVGTIAGKGYVIRSTSYLYRLVWNEETAYNFYTNYWVDNQQMNQAKVEAFDNSTDFRLELVGSEGAWSDVQSSIFTSKSDEDLIKMATVKATDKAIGKLQKTFEEFRIKTPLHSVQPLAAKIGLKESVEKGDKFEVLEQVSDANGRTKYKRVGVIKVDGKNIWDNTFSAEEMEEMERSGTASSTPYTLFKGAGNFVIGQLIRQLN